MLSGPARHYVFGLSVHCIRLFVYPFVCEDRSCYNNVSRTAWAILMKLTGNIY